MINIDYIMGLIDWNNSIEMQKSGIMLAKEVKCINVFLQPGKPYGKNVWDNCAIILSDRTDEELEPYLIALLEWLQDMNWPGAYCIFNRIQKYNNKEYLLIAINYCIKIATALDDEVWKNNLNNLKSIRSNRM